MLASRALALRSTRFSRARLLVFLAALAAFIAGGRDLGNPDPVLWGVAAVLALAMIVLVVRHGAVERERKRQDALARIQREALDRLDRAWERLPEPAPLSFTPSSTAVDLDLFGRASLFQLLGTVKTPPGRSTLAAWLTHEATPETIHLRQEAVAELAPHLDARQELERLADALRGATRDHEPFLRWAEGTRWLESHPGLLWASRALALAFPLGILLQATGVVPFPIWLAVLLVNLGVSGRVSRRIHDLFEQVESREGAYGAYRDLFARIENEPVQAPLLVRLRDSMGKTGARASLSIRRLSKLADMAQLRRSQMYLPIQAMTLWDVHVLHAMEVWQERSGTHAREWLESLGHYEALSGLAALAHDHPGWSQPEVDPDATCWEGTDLGHPLLPDNACVRNTVRLGPEGSFLLVTGSNMSGKSTLLRSIGINSVLAQAGSVVCAARLTLPPVRVATSIHVEDSLARGVSKYMAELRRLKEIVDDALRVARIPDQAFLFLLDEILGGTNSVERRIAVRRVVGHLLDEGGFGAVSTHDLELARVEELAERAVAVHFRETFRPGEDPPMTFDYLMRPGVATTTNALTLLELVGLDAPPGDA